MNQKTTQRCTQLVAPSLASGEQVEMVEVVQIGKVSAKKQLGIAAVAGIASGGMLMVATKPRAYFMILTNQRLFLVDNLQGSVGKKVVAAIPRTEISPGPLRTHFLTLSMEVTVQGTPQRFSWGRVQGKTARAVANVLGAPDNG